MTKGNLGGFQIRIQETDYLLCPLSIQYYSTVPWRNIPGQNVLWIFRPRNFVMKHPWDKTVLGTKQSLDKTYSANLQQNIPIFRDGLSVPENKTLRNFFRTNCPWPKKTSTATAPLLLSWQPGQDPAAWPRRRRPHGPTPSGMAKNYAVTISDSTIRLHTKFEASFVHFWKKFRDGFKCIWVMIVRKILFFKSVHCFVKSWTDCPSQRDILS
jgi:hypothetical protein